MALCSNCAYYSEVIDNMGRDSNDVGNVDNHYCPMYDDHIPNGIYYDNDKCQYHELKAT